MVSALTPRYRRGAANPFDDVVQPFRLESSGFHGRLVRLGAAVEAIVNRHGYPDAVASVLAESVAATGALAAALKFDGVFSLQLSGDGSVKYLVSDVTSGGDLRAYASFHEALSGFSSGRHAPIPHLFGHGYLAVTVDQGPHTERYQGLVDLTGSTLADCIHHYFRQSDQFSAVLKLSSGCNACAGWRAGSIMLQRSPDTEDPQRKEAIEEAWRHAIVMLGSCSDAELLDGELAPRSLLFRLFHEVGVRVYEPRPLRFRCRCSTARVEHVLASLSEAEVDEFTVDGRITVTCEFCNETRVFDRAELAQLRGA